MLFTPITIRQLQFRNRIGASSMCQYSATDGFANDWHMVHLGSLAVGGAGLVFSEAMAVSAEGRISPHDLGLWDDEHIAPLHRITSFVKAQGAVPGVQLAHAGRKASTARPWEGSRALRPDQGGWERVLAPSAIPFSAHTLKPHELSTQEVAGVIEAFRAAARRALSAGFEVVEVHAAHGYLLHEFLSPLSNHRLDEYGGSFENRTRLVLQVAVAVRREWPAGWPLFVRISATDWIDGGWTPDESVMLAQLLAARGVDVIDCSSGGIVPGAAIPVAPGYQVAFASRVRREASIATAAVGLITDSHQANEIVTRGEADFVLLARELLRNPRWPLHAAIQLGQEFAWPLQYERAKPTV